MHFDQYSTVLVYGVYSEDKEIYGLHVLALFLFNFYGK